VNVKFEILALIDLDCLISAPVAVQAQFPVFAGLDIAPSLYVEIKRLAIRRLKMIQPNLIAYKKLLRDCGKATGRDLGLSKLLLTEAPALAQGLRIYDAHQLWVNEKWMFSFLQLIRQNYSLSQRAG
jgi:hypothetical protein